MSVSGRAPIAQRFARDWNTVVIGDTRGKEVVAVADGVVIETKDGIAENESMTTRAVPITMETLLGNYVVLDIGNERYAVYAHLQPGLPVREGDSAEAGDVLGLVGNSGNSMGNHLHFQIVDRPSPLGGEGMPYVFEYFEVIGQRLGRNVEFWDPEVREREMPMDGAIVRLRAR